MNTQHPAVSSDFLHPIFPWKKLFDKANQFYYTIFYDPVIFPPSKGAALEAAVLPYLQPQLLGTKLPLSFTKARHHLHQLTSQRCSHCPRYH